MLGDDLFEKVRLQDEFFDLLLKGLDLSLRVFDGSLMVLVELNELFMMMK